MEHALVGALGVDEGGAAGFGEGEEAFGATSSLRGGVAEFGADNAFLLHAVEGGVEGSRSGFATGAEGDLGADGNPVGVVAETQDGEEDDLFELAEGCWLRHNNYNVGIARNDVKIENFWR